MAENPLDIDAARHAFADAIANRTFAPKFPLEINIRPGAVPDATVIHCHWRLAKEGPYSREITVQIAAGAMNRFRHADASARGKMLELFIRTFRIRLLEGGYNDKDPLAPPFIVSIDEHSIELLP
jgi:hypothetical protein